MVKQWQSEWLKLFWFWVKRGCCVFCRTCLLSRSMISQAKSKMDPENGSSKEKETLLGETWIQKKGSILNFRNATKIRFHKNMRRQPPLGGDIIHGGESQFDMIFFPGNEPQPKRLR